MKIIINKIFIMIMDNLYNVQDNQLMILINYILNKMLQ